MFKTIYSKIIFGHLYLERHDIYRLHEDSEAVIDNYEDVNWLTSHDYYLSRPSMRC